MDSGRRLGLIILWRIHRWVDVTLVMSLVQDNVSLTRRGAMWYPWERVKGEDTKIESVVNIVVVWDSHSDGNICVNLVNFGSFVWPVVVLECLLMILVAMESPCDCTYVGEVTEVNQMGALKIALGCLRHWTCFCGLRSLLLNPQKCNLSILHLKFFPFKDKKSILELGSNLESKCETHWNLGSIWILWENSIQELVSSLCVKDCFGSWVKLLGPPLVIPKTLDLKSG